MKNPFWNPTAPRSDLENSSPSKPLFIWVLFAGLLASAGLNGLRLYGAIQYWPILVVIDQNPGPLYVAITGGVFMLGFLGAFGTLWMRRRGAAWLVRGVVVLYAAWMWFDRLVFTQSAGGMVSWPYEVGTTLVLVLFALTAVQVMDR